MRVFSQEAIERPHRTWLAAEVFCKHARAIGQVTANASDEETVIAVVRNDLTFGGAWPIPSEDLYWLVPQIEDDEGGWAVIFNARSSVAEISDRCIRFARLAFRHWEVMQRYVKRQSSL
ncbi:hypothetical protein EI42_05454 [Thermosporothrix hazakensis]|jgi:hypothetical protein|uniref:Uncharacterized protein n=2 Tax=Thermosporothrix TaxID=768650 RepID=A0A326U7X1_THEHA|nr:hypothetical protein [Thermosporothrix hazakensis]PZW22432.1 hypothetical protein EI42_05454 [Thermosporothrix hazakensis]BBH86085.1 hypothetical protein KTC_08360 [Thermosporothrix sp. COM3]GCE45490.1 hypothetical protein KTH_03590 [Thermosporothrix hazakensis]